MFGILTNTITRAVGETEMETIEGMKAYYWMRLFLAISLALIILIIGISFTSPPEIQGLSRQSEIPVEIRFLAATELKDWVDGGKVFLLVDARRPDEYARGHIPTAVNVPYPHLEVARIELEEAGSDDPVVFYCNHPPKGKAGPCATVVARMVESGATQVYWFKGGIKAWRSLGYPVIGP